MPLKTRVDAACVGRLAVERGCIYHKNMSRYSRQIIIIIGIISPENMSRCSNEKTITLKASDYLALCEENERLKKEVEKLRKKLDDGLGKKPSRNVLDLRIVRTDMQPVVEKWLRYKREKGQSYKPTGFSTFVNKLMKLSGGNVETAKLIIEESIANNWAGIFPLKNNAARMPIGFVQTDNNKDKYKEQTIW